MIASSLTSTAATSTVPSEPVTYHLTLISSNEKTGPIPVTTTSASTCPPSCPFYGKGCYAKSGPLAIHWSKVTSGSRGSDLATLCGQVAKFPANQIWRHNQAGDLPGYGERVDVKALARLVKANAGRRGFTYTHKHNLKANLRAIREANEGGFTVNLSANSLAHADELYETKAGPVAVVLPIDSPSTVYTPAGRKVIACPHDKNRAITCERCGLCQKSARSVIVGLRAHGTQKRVVSAIAKG